MTPPSRHRPALFSFRVWFHVIKEKNSHIYIFWFCSLCFVFSLVGFPTSWSVPDVEDFAEVTVFLSTGHKTTTFRAKWANSSTSRPATRRLMFFLHLAPEEDKNTKSSSVFPLPSLVLQVPLRTWDILMEQTGFEWSVCPCLCWCVTGTCSWPSRG